MSIHLLEQCPTCHPAELPSCARCPERPGVVTDASMGLCKPLCGSCYRDALEQIEDGRIEALDARERARWRAL